MSPSRIAAALLILTALSGPPAAAQNRLTSPQEQFGFNLGDDYRLANYRQISAYWQKLDQESDRLVVREIGQTAEGRTMLMAIVSSPANIRDLDRYQTISRRLALAEGLTDDEARRLAKEGKSVVWIDGGLHATEVLGAQQLAEMVWQMVSRTDDETTRILDEVITLFVHANPDGNDLTADWYNRNPVPERRGNSPGLPRLYQKYIGHDNNRDFFASTQPETEAMNRVMYHEWMPQIVYNHHQTGPAGTVMFAPPFRDPFNYNFDPLVITQLDLVGAAMHSRFEAEGKPGVTMRSGARYSTWWNGGLRTTAYFHNMVGILTETIGNPTPMRIPYVAERVLPRADLPLPIRPQQWHFRQSIDYSVTANRAILDIAARNRENFLFNIYRMGKNSIDRGSRDSWTITASEVARANEAMAQQRGGNRSGGGTQSAASAASSAQSAAFDPYAEILHAPEARDPRGYVIPSDQPDFLTAIKFVNALREANVAVHRATAAFTVQGKRYPSGSFVVLTAQAFRPHVLDMFEPQDHPNDFPYPGAPPTPPYDNAGWTLAYSMGVQFDRILEGFTGPFERITDWNVKPAPGTVAAPGRPIGYVISPEANDAYHAMSRLLADGEEVFWLRPGQELYVRSGAATRGRLDRLAAELGVSFTGVERRPANEAARIRQPRVGLLDVYGGSMTSGWTRWIMEQFGIPFERTFPPRVEAGDLNARYDVLILPDGTVPDPNRTEGGGGPRDEQVSPAANDSIEASLPAEFRNQRGRITDRALASIRQFAERGGTVIAIGGATPGVAAALGLPVTNHLVENGEPLPRTKFYVPGSLLRVAVDTTQPLAVGLSGEVDVLFDTSPVFKLNPDAAAKGVKRVAWFASKTPLRSGWAWGQDRLEAGVAILEAPVGRGRAVLIGPEILFRAQPHGAFKFFFNALYAGSATR